MNDTPKHIQDLQLKIWLSKTPGERLFQFLKDNDDLLKAFQKTKEEIKLSNSSLQNNAPK